MTDVHCSPEPGRMTRRALLGHAVCGCAAVLLAGATGGAAFPRPRRGGPHPDPRPGIDASRVLPPEVVGGDAAAVAAFAAARAIPGILDGLRCQCGCADVSGMRSVLSCFEAPGMALDCEICQGVARLAARLHGKGRSLAGIREAVDARYGA
jgi:hypothetical protein